MEEQGRVHVELEEEILLVFLDNVRQATDGKTMCYNRIQQKLSRELGDSSLRIYQSKCVRKAHLEIAEELLSVFLDKLQAKKDSHPWGRENKLMKEEICGLKAQLNEAKQENSSEAVEYLHSHLAGLSEMVLTLQNNLQMQIHYTFDLQDQLQYMYIENEQLKQAVKQDLTQDMQQEASHQAKVAEAKDANSSEEVHYLYSELTGLNQMVSTLQENLEQQSYHRNDLGEKVQWLLKVKEHLEQDLQQERAELKPLNMELTKMNNALLEEKRRHAVSEAQLEEQMRELNTVKAALQEAEHQSKSMEIKWQEEKSSLLQETSSLRETLLKREQEADETESALASLRETEKSRALYEAQLEVQIKEFDTLKAAPKEAEHQAERKRQEDKSSLLQESEPLKKTLLQKEQAREEKEEALASQLKDLDSQNQKKKKKKKWYRRWF